MKILIDIGHPSHVHLFKHFSRIMIDKGHLVLFTVKEKEFEIELLKELGFDYLSLGRHFKTKLGKIWGLLKFNICLLQIMLKFKPDITLSHGSMYAAQVSWLLKKPHISFEDTFNFEQIRLYKPFTSCILTGSYNHPSLGYKNIKFHGYHEIAYLHSNYFRPNQSVLKELGLNSNEKYVIIRFVSWNATHDKGLQGISLENKLRAVYEFSLHAKVFISSEKKLPVELEKFQFPLPPNKMHHAIASASLIFGESATMASEAAVLGVPSVYLDNNGRLYTNEQEEKYKLIFNYSENIEDQIDSIKKGVEILKNQDVKAWKRRNKKMLSKKINVTTFLVWFIENWPGSFNIMKENPDYQYNFK